MKHRRLFSMPKLFPEFEMPDMTPAQGVSSKNQNVRAYYFDFEKGDFRVDGSGKSVLASPIDTWVQWCVKAINTERFKRKAYSNQYGAEIDEITQYNTRQARECWIERTISETLLADPLQRTSYTKKFAYNWMGDDVTVVFTICGQDGMEATIMTKA
ncbi:MAG: DUF2634 domain-containing protein [Bacteroidales bacterium]